jgi:DNA-binding transcriptional ArsR family regulator
MEYDFPMPRRDQPNDVFHAIADPSRREILHVLHGGESPVGDLVAHLALAQPQVSKHLKVLRDVDLVRCRVVGRQRLYRVHAPAMRPLQDWLARFTQLTNDRLDRLDDLLAEMRQHEPADEAPND